MMGQYLIEIGRQVCLTHNGATELTESNIHLRKFTKDQVKTMIAKNLQQVEKIDSKIGKSKDIEEKVELLSRQTGELCQMIAVLVSMQLHWFDCDRMKKEYPNEYSFFVSNPNLISY